MPQRQRCPRCHSRLFAEYDSSRPGDLWLVCLSCGYDRFIGSTRTVLTLDGETIAELGLRRNKMYG